MKVHIYACLWLLGSVWVDCIDDAAFQLVSNELSGSQPRVDNLQLSVSYIGIERNDIELFLQIPYGQDTGGENRFKPPRPYVPKAGTIVNAATYGPACPQQRGFFFKPLILTEVTEVSENCLHLNVARPKGTRAGEKLPVLVFIHGGSFWAGQNGEITNTPDGMILESVANGNPIIHVHIQYRLGLFGFAQSDALKAEGSENAGLRDQRLAIEWVRDHIDDFGGDSKHITIWGQSSGGLAVGMQILAYGGAKPVPFQQGICQSQALEPGITGNFTIDAMQRVVDQVQCNGTLLHSTDTIECLRDWDTETLLNASVATYLGDVAHNVGDIWLPVVDGDFLPAPPSQLIRQRRFANVTTMMGWADDDLNVYTDVAIKTANETRAFIASYVPGVNASNVDGLLDLYPVDEFQAKGDLSAEFYRTARIFRDIIMVCEPLWLGEYLAAAGNSVYLYDWNQTILEGPVQAQLHPGGPLGAIHTSEFAYVNGNLSHYHTNGYPFAPTVYDYGLMHRGSRSWSTFVARGVPGGLPDNDVFQGVSHAYKGNQTYVFVSGGPSEGNFPIEGMLNSTDSALQKQRLRERCAFINSPSMIAQLGY